MAFASKSPWVIHYDGSSCNGCDIEVLAALCPGFDVRAVRHGEHGQPQARRHLPRHRQRERAEHRRRPARSTTRCSSPRWSWPAASAPAPAGSSTTATTSSAAWTRPSPSMCTPRVAPCAPEQIIDAVVAGVAKLDEKSAALAAARRRERDEMTTLSRPSRSCRWPACTTWRPRAHAEGWRYVQILAVNTEEGIDLVYSYHEGRACSANFNDRAA